MPLISPIGSGLGVRNEHNLEIIRKMCTGKYLLMLELENQATHQKLWN